MTIDELLSLAGLTANDEIPVWDAEAADEATKKIKAQNMAASVKALAGLVGEAEFTEQLADKADVIVDTASGAIASFSDGAAVAAKDITIGIEPVQSGSGDPSPTNVRPISGWTGANVTRTGKNLLNIDAAGTITTPDNTQRNGLYIKVNGGGAYYTISRSGGSAVYFYFKSQNGNWTASGMAGTERNKTFQSYGDMLCVHAGGGGILATTTDLQIENGTTATAYEPFGETIPISWQSEAGTVYGGTLDVTTGLLTVTMAEVDLGTLTWNKTNTSAGHWRFNAVKDDIKKNKNTSTKSNVKCSEYIAISPDGTWLGQRGISIDNIATLILICDETYTDAASFKAAMSGVQLVYELATPQTYQLTPTEVEMLLGDNNVWADTGDSTVTYRADTKLYIQKINAPTDDDMIADAQIASGKYFIVGGNLYKSTTTIPAGDAINPGSNCIMTNLADALNALNT